MTDLILTIEQKQTLSQKAIQNIEILQMSAHELERYLNEVTLENPVIDPESSLPSPEDITIHIKNHNSDYRDSYTRKSTDFSPVENSFETLLPAPEESLFEYLIFQLIPYFHTAQDKSILYFLVESIDHNGFLTLCANDLCSLFQISTEASSGYIHLLQSMEPAGIGARNLSECLLLQLERLNHPSTPLSIKIIQEHFDCICNNHIKQLVHSLEVSAEEITLALTFIKSLNPRPSNGFYCGATTAYIQPDVIILQEYNQFHITINSNLVAGFKINDYYMQMLNHSDKSVRNYITQKYQQAEWINKCLEQRNTTLLKISQQILMNQKLFFLNGPNHLKPMLQSDISTQLELNDSTISRAIRDKYIECFWGVFPFKYFFSKPVNVTNSDMTVTHLKSLIKELIDKEDKKHPLSDQKLVTQLSNHSITIARRTIAKYRTELLIPDTSKRRTI